MNTAENRQQLIHARNAQRLPDRPVRPRETDPPVPGVGMLVRARECGQCDGVHVRHLGEVDHEPPPSLIKDANQMCAECLRGNTVDVAGDLDHADRANVTTSNVQIQRSLLKPCSIPRPRCRTSAD